MLAQEGRVTTCPNGSQMAGFGILRIELTGARAFIIIASGFEKLPSVIFFGFTHPR